MVKNILVLDDGTEIAAGTVGQNAILSLTCTETVSKTTDLCPGAACSNKLEITIWVEPGTDLPITSGTRLTHYRETSGHRTLAGTYWAVKPTSQTRNTYKVYAYDAVSRLDSVQSTWLRSIQDQFPMTLWAFAGLVAQRCGVTIANNSLPRNGTYLVQAFYADNLTGRQLLAWVAEASCTFLRATSDGKIEFAWYTNYSTSQSIGPTVYIYYAIDVSKHQGKFDWQAAYSRGIRHAMLRAGYGRYSSQVDPQFERNAAECARLGIQYGVYWYSYASSPAEARQEARCCLAAIKGKHLCLPVAYDIEYEPCILRLTNAQRTALVEAFLGEVEAAGYYGILYASRDFIRNRLDYKALAKYDIWVAQYGNACTCPLPYGIWQYSSRNALGIPGYGTSLDCNRVYKDYEQLMIQAGLQGHTAPAPEDTAPNKLDKQRITIGRISSGDRSAIRALCDNLGLVTAGLYRETCVGGNQWMLDVGPVSSGDAWYIMRKCAELQLIDAGLYKAEYVEG